MKALIIEDDPAMQYLLKRQLSGIIRDVVTASGFEEALEILNRIPPPDVIFLDLALADSSTEETIARIPEIRAANEESVILVLSGTVTAIARDQVVAAGADDFFLKQDMIPMGSSKKGFMENLSDAIKSLVKQPSRYQKNVRIVELLAERLAKRTQRLEA